MSGRADAPVAGPPPLRPFGLVLHRDGRFTHEGEPIRHRKLRAAFERGVAFLPEEGKYVVRLGRFRGQVDVEEAAFFVRAVDLEHATVLLSDGSVDALEPASLRVSALDPDVLLCTVKRSITPPGVPARFLRDAQGELLAAVEEGVDGLVLRAAGALHPLPSLA